MVCFAQKAPASHPCSLLRWKMGVLIRWWTKLSQAPQLYVTGEHFQASQPPARKWKSDKLVVYNFTCTRKATFTAISSLCCTNPWRNFPPTTLKLLQHESGTNIRPLSLYLIGLIIYEKNYAKKIRGRWVFGVYNAYNRLNPFYINLGLGEAGKRSLYQVSLLPVLPFVNYQIDFWGSFGSISL